MKLTNQQIDIINKTLVLNGLVYDDIKFEVLDHIASEIEVAMDHKEIQFEGALKTAFANWGKKLEGSRSYWIRGYAFTPNIIIEKSLKMVKHIYFMSFSLGIIAAALINLIIKFNQQLEVFYVINTTLQAASVIELVVMIYLKVKLRQSKFKSTYSFLFHRNGFIQVITLIVLATGLFYIKGYSNFNDLYIFKTRILNYFKYFKIASYFVQR